MFTKDKNSNAVYKYLETETDFAADPDLVFEIFINYLKNVDIIRNQLTRIQKLLC